MQKIMIMLGAVLTMTLGALSAHATTLTNINGDVKINRGNGFLAITKPVSVQTGDKILLGRNATANILYPNGISVPVKAGQVAIVRSAYKKPMTVGEGGAAAAAANTGALGTGIGATALVVGGAVAVAVGVAVVVNSAKKDAPASP